jgi:ApaG protein
LHPCAKQAVVAPNPALLLAAESNAFGRFHRTGCRIIAPQPSAPAVIASAPFRPENPIMPAVDPARYRISVNAVSTYLAEQSDPTADLFTFAYTVTIENLGTEPAQLLSRHWIVTDANGETQEVRGAGVVGEQPHLKPGERYRYSSGTQIPTPVGSMHGSYFMRADDGTRFEAEIPAFSLSSQTRMH